jgi:transcriptional regulator with XRE-family HTH domain
MYSVGRQMNHIGELIESRRRKLGLSRLHLATRLGVSNQTVLNFERDPTYNLGTSLLRRLEEALNVTFDLTMKEGMMSTGLKMGNDEFILYIRKNFPECTRTNDELGKSIWRLIEALDSTAEQVGAEPCRWEVTGASIGETKLPQTAMQFRFKRSQLPALYEALDSLGLETT